HLAHGQVADFGRTDEVIPRYLAEMSDATAAQDFSVGRVSLEAYRRPLYSDPPVTIREIRVGRLRGAGDGIPLGSELAMHLVIDALRPVSGANVTLRIKSEGGDLVATIFSWDYGYSVDVSSGRHEIRVGLPGLILPVGSYVVDVGINQAIST